MTKKFDLVAIGTGSGASTVASACRAAGWQVAIIDSRPFGGTCALRWLAQSASSAARKGHEHGQTDRGWRVYRFDACD